MIDRMLDTAIVLLLGFCIACVVLIMYPPGDRWQLTHVLGEQRFIDDYNMTEADCFSELSGAEIEYTCEQQ
jgi:hypothetical protein